MLSGGSTIASLLFMLRTRVPSLLAPGTSFLEDSFSMDGGGGGMVWGQFKGITFMVHFIFNLGEGNGNPLQHSCLENPMDGGA